MNINSGHSEVSNADHSSGDSPRFEYSMISFSSISMEPAGGNDLFPLAAQAVPGVVNKLHCPGIHWGQLCLEG